MKSAQRERAIELRLTHKLGYKAIAEQVKVSKSTLSRWLEDLPLSEERILELRREAWSVGEAKRERFRQTMRAKRDERDRQTYLRQKKKLARISEQSMFIAGLMLYAAEGDKKSKADIAFTNTDPALILFFARWIVRFLGFPKDKLRIQLHLYENMNVKAEELFWIHELGMSQKQLWKSQVRTLRPKSFSYRDTSRHGTCKLYIGSVPKKAEIKLSIRAFFDTYNVRLRA
jgi:transcriptional regulator with XRE-family HTH domain